MSNTKRILLLDGIILGIFIIFILISRGIHLLSTNYPWPDWTGLGDYTAANGEFFRRKTLWDFLELILVPAALALIALLFSRQKRSGDKNAAEERARVDREIEAERLQEQALQSYLDKMTELLLKENLRASGESDEVRKIARARTLATLRILEGKRKGLLLKFLHDSALISGEQKIVHLDKADLSEVDLSGAVLGGADLSGANLWEANLRAADLLEANLNGANLLGANLLGAKLIGANLSEADLSEANLRAADLSVAILENANLRDANLRRASLRKANLREASLSGADLSGADLTRAFLRNTDLSKANLRDATLNEANLSGADLSEAILRNAHLFESKYNKKTIWPEGFDPEKARAKLVPEDD
jgi:uncharacterized protein YjbI with pentapeptide repeats